MVKTGKKVSKECIYKQLKKLKPILEQNFGVVKIGIFGSVARGDNTVNSDVDILVEIQKTKFSLIDFVKLKQFLEEKLECKVDLVMKRAIKPKLKKDILNEVIYV
ncbi:hypothetical protein SAMN06265339_1531 [Desulfurobacterium pacificum]|uniref:Polymerase nucleotidyl transferase domain-containing protein n=1 Tax=Desulfurobacterium pacificum TaxID=240166 RepID=A0ABY1NUY0_9BACT|nr:nucleotidyltransferase family protein [Desulfurobacterium pacificum]SMP17497.1 hypothetical protein SAMN06265339_1531 [Desulfurobacterium pacificum]